jgi:hypothetical protein
VDLSLSQSKKSKLTPSLCGPFREAIEVELSRARNAMAIWQDLVDQGFQQPMAAANASFASSVAISRSKLER